MLIKRIFKVLNAKSKTKVKVKRVKLKDGGCICDKVYSGEIDSGYCHKHKTDWV